MCGIVGYIGEKKATPILIDGLLKLEYRGYDSAGISSLENTGITTIKSKGRVSNLAKCERIDTLKGTLGIAHTRWATHGKPSDENAHPHSDNSGIFSVVHNGIIENYKELKDFLETQNYHFLSQTDTEVIPNLIHYYYLKLNNNFLEAVHRACNDLKGSYAICVLCACEKNKIICTKKDSPLVIGTSNTGNYIASDIPAIISYTKDFYLLEDNEFVEVFDHKLQFYDKNIHTIEKKLLAADWKASSAEKGDFEDYMLKEIFEQPHCIRETIGSRINLEHLCEFPELDISKEKLSHFNKIYMVACGTAMHAGLASKKLYEKLLNIPVTVEVASEFRYQNPIIDDKTLAIFISQSGETADTIAALKLANEKNATTIAITNVIGSSITRYATFTLYTHAGPEIAVASTKAYTSQIVLLDILAIYLAEILQSTSFDILEKLKQDILSIPNKVKNILENTKSIQDFAKKSFKKRDIFFLGRGIDYTVAMEGSLKLKEISYIHSEAYPAGELKHGPIALVEDGILVVTILTDYRLSEKTISNISEVITRGAMTLVITNQNLPNANYDAIFSIPKIDAMLSPVLSIIPLQLFAYYIAKDKNLDVDKPRNLAKSVTVE